MNSQTGREMHVNLIRYHVYQRLKADAHKANLNMTMPQFDERWNTVYDSLRHFENGCLYIYLCSCCHKLSTFILPFYHIQPYTCFENYAITCG